MQVEGYEHTGGRHTESTLIAHLLRQAGAVDPSTGQPLSEPLAFALSGGIGAGYSFCPSCVKHGTGSGISIVGRHRTYDTSGGVYRAAFERLDLSVHVTETTARGKARAQLEAELADGRPVIVFTPRTGLPLQPALNPMSAVGMSTLLVHAIRGEQAHVGDRAPGSLTLSLDALADLRAHVCSHRNRTLTLAPLEKRLSKTTLRDGLRSGLRACAEELLRGQMQTFSLPGVAQWAKMIANDRNKAGWLRAFSPGFLYMALRDAFDSIETQGTGGGLYRASFADALEAAAGPAGRKRLTEVASLYRQLGADWTGLADALLPSGVPLFTETRKQLRRREQAFVGKGVKGRRTIDSATERLQALEAEARAAFPLDATATRQLLEGLVPQIEALHAQERAAAQALDAAAA